MITSRYLHLIAAVVLILAVGFTGVFMANPALLGITASESDFEYEDKVFGSDVINIDIRVDEADWASMLENATQEEYILCDVTVNGTAFSTVGIRPKGNSSLSMVAQDDTTDRFSFKFEFDRYITGQTCFGLDKLVINNIQSDSTYMKEYLSYDLMSYIGVDTPLYTYANVTVNGEDWGFYLAVEALEESFVQRVYDNSAGMLYKPESMGERGAGRMQEFIEDAEGDDEEDQAGRPQEGDAQDNQNSEDPGAGTAGGQSGRADVGGGMGGLSASGGGSDLQYTDDDPDSYSAIFNNAVFDATDADYARVIEALRNLSDGTELEKYIDVDEVLRYFAANTVLVNLDSYQSSMQHNYYLYEQDGQLSILPWDYNLSFAGFQAGTASAAVNFPIDTPVTGVELSERPLLGKLLEVEEYRERYHQYLNEIEEGYFKSGHFDEEIDRLSSLIDEYVKNDASAFVTYEEYTQSLPMLKEFGRLRALSIAGQLSGDIPSTTQGQSEEPDALVDASSLSLSMLGSQGGGMNGGGGGFQGGGAQPGGRGGQAGVTLPQGNASGQSGSTTEQQAGAAGQSSPEAPPEAGASAGRSGDTGGNRGEPPGQGDTGESVGGDMAGMQGMRQAMEIVASAGGGELTEKQLSQLAELGLTPEQIERLTSAAQGGQGGFGGMQMPDRGNAGGRPDSVLTSGGSVSSVPLRQSAPILILSGAALLGGLLFVFLWRRRRYSR